MELLLATRDNEIIEDVSYEVVSTAKSFIEANTVETSLVDLQQNHLIPVFIKDNELVISHAEFIETTFSCLSNLYTGETVCKPSIRVSHPVKGRIPEARNKPANDLLQQKIKIGDKVTFDTDQIETFKQETSGDSKEIRQYQRLVLAGANQVGVVSGIDGKLTTVDYQDGWILPIPTRYLVLLPA